MVMMMTMTGASPAVPNRCISEFKQNMFQACVSGNFLAATSCQHYMTWTQDQELAAALSGLDKADLQKLKSAVAGGKRVVVDS